MKKTIAVLCVLVVLFASFVPSRTAKGVTQHKDYLVSVDLENRIVGVMICYIWDCRPGPNYYVPPTTRINLGRGTQPVGLEGLLGGMYEQVHIVYDVVDGVNVAKHITAIR